MLSSTAALRFPALQFKLLAEAERGLFVSLQDLRDEAGGDLQAGGLVVRQMDTWRVCHLPRAEIQRRFGPVIRLDPPYEVGFSSEDPALVAVFSRFLASATVYSDWPSHAFSSRVPGCHTRALKALLGCTITVPCITAAAFEGLRQHRPGTTANRLLLQWLFLLALKAAGEGGLLCPVLAVQVRPLHRARVAACIVPPRTI